MERLLDASNATAYLFGHSHVHGNYWWGDKLMSMAATSGNPGGGQLAGVTAAFSVFALDDGPSEISVDILGEPPEVLTVPWPAVMITRPADRGFGALPLTSEENPHAVPLPRASSGNILHAGAFSPAVIDAVYFRVDNGVEALMDVQDGYYRALFDTPDADECQITVRAESAGQSNSQTVTVSLRN